MSDLMPPLLSKLAVKAINGTQQLQTRAEKYFAAINSPTDKEGKREARTHYMEI